MRTTDDELARTTLSWSRKTVPTWNGMNLKEY